MYALDLGSLGTQLPINNQPEKQEQKHLQGAHRHGRVAAASRDMCVARENHDLSTGVRYGVERGWSATYHL